MSTSSEHELLLKLARDEPDGEVHAGWFELLFVALGVAFMVGAFLPTITGYGAEVGGAVWPVLLHVLQLASLFVGPAIMLQGRRSVALDSEGFSAEYGWSSYGSAEDAVAALGPGHVVRLVEKAIRRRTRARARAARREERQAERARRRRQRREEREALHADERQGERAERLEELELLTARGDGSLSLSGETKGGELTVAEPEDGRGDLALARRTRSRSKE